MLLHFGILYLTELAIYCYNLPTVNYKHEDKMAINGTGDFSSGNGFGSNGSSLPPAENPSTQPTSAPNNGSRTPNRAPRTLHTPPRVHRQAPPAVRAAHRREFLRTHGAAIAVIAASYQRNYEREIERSFGTGPFFLDRGESGTGPGPSR